MTSRRRQRGERTAGVLRGTRRNSPSVQQIEPRGQSIRWRIVSAVLVMILGSLLVVFFTSDSFFVRSITVSGLNYLTHDEVFDHTDIAGLHIFWIDPEGVRASVRQVPSVADAQVSLSWPPNMVHVHIEEREPALIWEQGGVAAWVDIQGRVMSRREERSDLIRVVSTADDAALTGDDEIGPNVVYGALQLQDLLPQTGWLRYDAVKGLGYQDANGWVIWLGDGTNMAEKILIYESIASYIQAQGVNPGEINIVNPDAPYFTVAQGQ